MADFRKALDAMIAKHKDVRRNTRREDLIQDVIQKKEAIVSENGALAKWTPPESTGRSPKDTYIVKNDITKKTVDWDSPNSNPMTPETFDMLIEDALKTLAKKKTLYMKNRTLGADTSYSLPVTIVTDSALTSLFTYHMFRPVQKGIEKSIFADTE
ncbi:MAG: phosphoenolpyruvate carboxykinase (ATP), partial [Candidatus Aenigmatarchaeota archaeon]